LDREDLLMFGRAAIVAFIMLLDMAGIAVAEPCIAADEKGQYSPIEHVRCLRQRAEQGDVIAQYLLGSVYLLGQGVTQDYAESVRWLRRAADQGHPAAQFVLGGMYAVGRGVPVDLVRAHMWFNVSGAQGYRDGGEYRDKLAHETTPAQIAEAQRLARE
jgi:uncharacterized protein